MQTFSLSPLSYTARTKKFPGTLAFLERIHSEIERKVFSLSLLVYTASRRIFPGTLAFLERIPCDIGKSFSFLFPLILYTVGKKKFPGTLAFPPEIFSLSYIGEKSFLFRFSLILYTGRTKKFPGTLVFCHNPQQKTAKVSGLTYSAAPEKKIKRKSLGGE
jgi:hypothetical protein